MARFEAESIESLESDWPTLLQQTAEWRAFRQEKALSLHLHFVVPETLAWDAIAFVAGKLLTAAAALPAEFAGLRLEPVVFAGPRRHVYLGMTINSEATARREDGSSATR